MKLRCRLFGHDWQWRYGYALPLAPLSVTRQCARCREPWSYRDARRVS